MSQRDRFRLYHYWSDHNVELLESIFTAQRYRAAYVTKVKFENDFIELDDLRNKKLLLEQIRDEMNHLSSLEERLPLIEIRSRPAVDVRPKLGIQPRGHAGNLHRAWPVSDLEGPARLHSRSPTDVVRGVQSCVNRRDLGDRSPE
jgi:hypothetical protein